MELLVCIILLLATTNGLAVPPACWWILGGWSAIHLAIAWFYEPTVVCEDTDDANRA